MDAGGASRKFGVCHTAHFNAAPAESGFSLQLNNNDKILCTHAVPRGIRTHVCMEKKREHYATPVRRLICFIILKDTLA
jgi:hypothetical protein